MPTSTALIYSKKPNSMMMLTLLIVILESVSSLHFQAAVQDPKEYSKETYFSQLTGMQQRFSRDLNTINQKFKDINLKLANTNISGSEKVVFLQENLANERDSLFNIQRYLNVPFALRSCQCVNVTDEQKAIMKTEIQDVKKSINSLEQAVNLDSKGNPVQNPKCPQGKCAAVQSIKNQITQMKNYVKIMNDTVTSQCCKVVNYVYRDNLVSTNSWVYGTTNQTQYRKDIFNQSATANLTQCPTDRPFANKITNQCLACPSDKPLFDLGIRQCIASCQNKSLILDAASHQCDFNRTCELGKHFSTTTNHCQITLGTDSSCPPDRPIWNPQLLSCGKCPSAEPYFDSAVRSCRKCTDNEVWQEYTTECINKNEMLNCGTGSFYNRKTTICELIPNNTTNTSGGKVGGTTPNQTVPTPNTTAPESGQSPTGTYSQCPPSTPFWSTSDLACYQCPDVTPSFNQLTSKCEICPSGTTWSATTITCKSNPKTCPQNQTYNALKNICEVNTNCQANQVFNSATGNCDSFSPSGQVGMCPPQSPFWNAQTLYCQKCNQVTPYWNDTLKTCQICPVNTRWDINSDKCVSTIQPCATGQNYNTNTSKCEAIVCPANTPIYNYANQRCQSCPIGTTFNNKSLLCESNSPQRTNTSICPAQTPYWNPQKLACFVCPINQILDANNNCQPLVAHFIAFPRHQLKFVHQQSMNEKHTLVESKENHQKQKAGHQFKVYE